MSQFRQASIVMAAIACTAFVACKSNSSRTADSAGGSAAPPVDTTAMAPPNTTGTAAATPTTAPVTAPTPPSAMSDANILAAANEGDSAEVVLARYVEGATKNASVKSFAKLLERDHSKGMTQVSSTATKAGITPQMPAGDTTSQALSNVMGRMQSLSGRDLDTAFVNYEVADHQADISAAQQMATAAQNASVKAMVQMELPELQRHLNAAEKLSAQLTAKK